MFGAPPTLVAISNICYNSSPLPGAPVVFDVDAFPPLLPLVGVDGALTGCAPHAAPPPGSCDAPLIGVLPYVAAIVGTPTCDLSGARLVFGVEYWHPLEINLRLYTIAENSEVAVDTLGCIDEGSMHNRPCWGAKIRTGTGAVVISHLCKLISDLLEGEKSVGDITPTLVTTSSLTWNV
ncbi:hypothetical protein SUGI_0948610 [Cryptomeria japonica]|nr:hypothetical protein SUGI_0948610 [Cryptomeria japonica]